MVDWCERCRRAEPETEAFCRRVCWDCAEKLSVEFYQGRQCQAPGCKMDAETLSGGLYRCIECFDEIGEMAE